MVQGLAAVALVVSLLALPAASVLPPPCPAGQGTLPCEAWSRRGDFPGDDIWRLRLEARDGRVFATGETQEPGATFDVRTAAHDAATGALLWSASYAQALPADEQPFGLALSPDGASIAVVGLSSHCNACRIWVSWFVVVYDASTGAEQWAWAGEVDGVATSPAFGPDGALYVAGRSENGAATVAFGSDGAVRWKDHRPMGGSTGSNDAPYIAVAPDGTRVATVTARLTGGIDIVALGYDAATGARAWNVTWGGPGTDIPYGVAVSPADGTIFIAGMATTQLPAARDIVVLALAPQDGAVRWVAITDGSPTTDLGLLAFSDAAAAVATDGARVFAGGSSDPVGVTVAYDAHTGAKLWSRLLAGEVMDMAALPRTGHVAVTYRAADATIEVLDGASGAPLGLAAYDEMTTADEFAWTMAADGPHLVFGGGTWITDYWFAAYDLGPLG